MCQAMKQGSHLLGAIHTCALCVDASGPTKNISWKSERNMTSLDVLLFTNCSPIPPTPQSWVQPSASDGYSPKRPQEMAPQLCHSDPPLRLETGILPVASRLYSE